MEATRQSPKDQEEEAYYSEYSLSIGMPALLVPHPLMLRLMPAKAANIAHWLRLSTDPPIIRTNL